VGKKRKSEYLENSRSRGDETGGESSLELQLEWRKWNRRVESSRKRAAPERRSGE
jgi:hypothetical protein